MASFTKRKSGGYQARVRRRGYPTLTETFRTLADAKIWARQQESGIDRRTLPDILQARRTTLADCIEEYRQHITPRHKGAAAERSKLDIIASHPMANLPLAELTGPVIDGYILKRLEKVSGSTVNRELAVLTQILKRARFMKWMIHNPMEELCRPKDNPGRERRLTDDERKRLLVELKKSRNKNFRSFVILAHETGMRRGELVDVDWHQVNFKQRIISLKPGMTKNGKSRKVPLTLLAIDTLCDLKERNGKRTKVFGTLTRDAIKKCWTRLCDRADVEDFRLHDLRHERVSSLVDAGWNVIEAMAVSGHRDMKAFRGYVHPQTETLVDKLDRLPSALVTSLVTSNEAKE